MIKVIYQGQLFDEFEGFNEDQLFKMSNGTYWIQAHYRYWYHYAYRPNVAIFEENGKYYLEVANEKIEVRQLFNVVESKIDGSFKGWDGKSVYKLCNGQIWVQTEYKYTYTYANSPSVIIYEGYSGIIMKVAGTTAKVKRQR